MFQPGGPSLYELTRQALSSTRRGYDLIAPRFDATPFRTPDALLTPVARHLGRVRGDALDLCCGTGAATQMLTRVVDGRVVGLDFSPGMLAQARARLPEHVELVEGDARDLPYDRAFDLIVSFGAFGHITLPEQPAFLQGIHRALRPGGRFVFVTSEHPPRFSRTTLVYRGFNLVMRVRNRLVRPRFVMYYLNFLWPEVADRLEAAGFTVARYSIRGGPFSRAWIVEATRP